MNRKRPCKYAHNTLASLESNSSKNAKKRLKSSLAKGIVHDETVLHLFCRCMSIRGVSKITSQSLFLRYLWSSFVILMALILVGATTILILDYFKYDVTLHHKDLQNNSDFPAITICHHHAFSKEAYKFWDEKKILSPSEFNLYMRKQARGYLQNDSAVAQYFYFFDSINIYYQNLLYNESVALGHNYSIVLNCLKRSENVISFENDCKQLKGYVVKRLSHPQHFNCFTFEPSSVAESRETKFFSLIISMGRTEPDYANHEQAFLIDVFEQAKGLRAVIHESGTLPDIDKEGLHVEPGKLNEISFQPIYNIRLNTPRKPCVVKNESQKFRDLDTFYNYSHLECINLEKQKLIIKNCNCTYSLYPRPVMPSIDQPYCGRLWPTFDPDKFYNRLICVQQYLDTTPQSIYEKCLERCSYYTYDATVSITKWRAKQWQLHWLRLQNVATKVLYENSTMLNHSEAKASWMSYLNRKNLSDLDLQDSRKALNLDGDDFAYVILKKKGSILKERREKLVLSLTVLLSRIGGFCSLLIGLTVAAVVELIEFLYLLIVRYSVVRYNQRNNFNVTSIRNNFTDLDASDEKTNFYILNQKETPKEILL